jgi:hypothetical protein
MSSSPEDSCVEFLFHDSDAYYNPQSLCIGTCLQDMAPTGQTEH